MVGTPQFFVICFLAVYFWLNKIIDEDLLQNMLYLKF